MEYHAIITHILEVLAALVGFYYLRRNKNSKLRPLVYFLVFTVFVEAVGSYTTFIKVLEFLKPINETMFKENFWLYNSYVIVCMIFYLTFYKRILLRESLKKILNVFIIISILVVIFNICSDSVFFNYIENNFLWTTLSVFICVTFYFYEVLMSDNILKFYNSPLFYISIGLLVWWLIFPLMIFYMPYYKEIYPEVINFRTFILIGTNVILYGCYIVGFLRGKE